MSSSRPGTAFPGAPGKNQRAAYGYAVCVILLWATVAAAFKLSLRHLRPTELLMWSSGFSLLALGLILVATGRTGAVRKAATPAGLRRAAWLGFLTPFLYYSLLFQAYDRLPAQLAQPLNQTWTIALALLSVPLLGQKLSGRDWLAVGVCYAGAFVLATGGSLAGLSAVDPLGVGLALISAGVWAYSWLASAKDDRDPVAGLFWNFVFGLAFSALGALFQEGWRAPDWQGLAGAAWVGFFEMGVTFVLWLKALKLAEKASSVGNLVYFTPFLSLFAIHFLVGEELRPATFAGLGLIVIGNLLQRQKS